MKTLIKNLSLLEEGHKFSDQLDYSILIKNFTQTLNSIEANSTVGLIGNFGTGKSTMLYQQYKDLSATSNKKWVVFDAWKFPERSELWEGFILEIADQIGAKRNRILKKIEGKNTRSKIFDITTDVLGAISDKLENFNILDKFIEIFKSSPAIRVFQLQEILEHLIQSLDKELYIVIEDIDRSGDKGVFFLETIRQFIKNKTFKNKIIVIIPIGTEKYDNSEYLFEKSLDYIVYFQPSNINFTNFIQNIFEEELFKEPNWVSRINYLLQRLIAEKSITIRKIKSILRIANILYKNLNAEDKVNINPEIFIYFCILKELKDLSFAYKRNNRQITSDKFGYNFLIWAGNNTIKEPSQIVKYSSLNIPIILDNNCTSLVPKFEHSSSNFNKETVYRISNIYLKVLNEE